MDCIVCESLCLGLTGWTQGKEGERLLVLSHLIICKVVYYFVIVCLVRCQNIRYYCLCPSAIISSHQYQLLWISNGTGRKGKATGGERQRERERVRDAERQAGGGAMSCGGLEFDENGIKKPGSFSESDCTGRGGRVYQANKNRQGPKQRTPWRCNKPFSITLQGFSATISHL